MSVTKQWIAPVLAVLLLPVQPADASQWLPVAAADGRSVEIDTRRIDKLKGDRATAWTRLTLEAPALDFEHRLRYTAVEALNHYDCAGGRFATQRRVFLLDGRAVRGETVTAPQGMEVRPDSLDARLFDAACGDGSAAAYWASAAASRPRPMHAEMVSAGDVAPARGMTVADAPAERPRFIDMPVIDKSKAEDPFKNAPPSAQPPAAQSPAVPAAPSSARQPAPQAPRAVPPPPPVPLALPDLSRQERERLLATSGPRRAPAPRKAPDPTPPVLPAPDYSRVQWGYAGLGAPENWAKLRPEFAPCGAGKRQSPIDIRSGIRVDLEPIKFDYRKSHFRIVDSGHTVRVEVGEGSGITVMGRYWPLQHIEFRRPGEGRIDGQGHEMSLHLVHRDFDGSTAIVAVMLERGAEHPVVQTLWNHMPLEVGMEILPRDVTIEPARLLPERHDYFTYMGSLTTPPCTENVLWMVLKAPVQVSPAQIAIFARLYPNNARPLQPVNDRLIKGSR